MGHSTGTVTERPGCGGTLDRAANHDGRTSYRPPGHEICVGSGAYRVRFPAWSSGATVSACGDCCPRSVLVPAEHPAGQHGWKCMLVSDSGFGDCGPLQLREIASAVGVIEGEFLVDN